MTINATDLAKAYPNPSTKSINIEFNGSEDEIIEQILNSIPYQIFWYRIKTKDIYPNVFQKKLKQNPATS